MSWDSNVAGGRLASWNTVSISWTQVVHEPKVTVCISSELLLFAIENCLVLYSLQDKVGHKFFTENRMFILL